LKVRYDFNGASSQKFTVQKTPPRLVGINNFTISVKFATTASGKRQQLFQFGGDSLTAGEGFWLYIGTDNKLHFDLSNVGGSTGADAVNTGTFRLAGCTCINGVYQLYIDGLPTGSPSTLTSNFIQAYCSIGGPANGTSYNLQWFFYGIIKEVAAFDTGFSDRAMYDFYANGLWEDDDIFTFQPTSQFKPWFARPPMTWQQ
jgi:hypothetical protein